MLHGCLTVMLLNFSPPFSQKAFIQSLSGFLVKRCPAPRIPGHSEFRCLCLQAEGGKRAGAVATVVAAVDLARVRLPVHAEGGVAEEEEVEVRQQAREIVAEKRVVESKLPPTELPVPAPAPAPVPTPAPVSVASERHTVQVSQVGADSFCHDCDVNADAALFNRALLVTPVPENRGVVPSGRRRGADPRPTFLSL